MSHLQTSPMLGTDKQGETACGATTKITPEIPFIHYRDEIVYFCGEDCKVLYESDPLCSCMAARLLSGR
jgi:hypothetical protein